VIGVLEEEWSPPYRLRHRWRSHTLLDQDVSLLFFFHLAIDEFDDVRMVDIEDDHLGGAARLAAALDDAGEGVEAFHELTGPEAMPPPREFPCSAEQENLCRCRSPLEEHTFGRVSP